MQGCGYKTSVGQVWTRMGIIDSLMMQCIENRILQMQVEKQNKTSKNVAKP